MASQEADRQLALRREDSKTSHRSSISDIRSDADPLNPFEDPVPPSPLEDEDGHLEATPRATDASHRPLSLQPSFQLRPDDSQRRSVSQRYSRQSSPSSRREALRASPSPQPNDTSNRDSSLYAASVAPRRMTSNASTVTMPRPASPYRGTNGPSHPYAMHPQDVGLGRTISNATSTTTGTVPRFYNGPSRPTHAYGSHAQDTAGEDDLSTPMVPLGFVTRGSDRYQRRLGPEGEDADDFIGPEGYTEQLPPYTRYPNDLPPKDSPVESPPSATSQRNPFSDSHVALNLSPTQETQDESSIPRAGPAGQVEMANEESPSADVGGHFKESFKRKSKKLIFGRVPLWYMVVIVVLVLVIVIGVIAGAVGRHRQTHPHPEPDHGPPPDTTVAA